MKKKVAILVSFLVVVGVIVIVSRKSDESEELGNDIVENDNSIESDIDQDDELDADNIDDLEQEQKDDDEDYQEDDQEDDVENNSGPDLQPKQDDEVEYIGLVDSNSIEVVVSDQNGNKINQTFLIAEGVFDSIIEQGIDTNDIIIVDYGNIDGQHNMMITSIIKK